MHASAAGTAPSATVRGSRDHGLSWGPVDPVVLGIIGLGTMGNVHVRHLIGGIPGIRLACVVDAQEEVARAMGELYRVAWSTSSEALLEDAQVAGVLIATPTASHPELIQAAAQAGKHVFCEKPLALTSAAAREAVMSAGRANVFLQVGFHRRFDPAVGVVARRLQAGDLGTPLSFRSSFMDSSTLIDRPVAAFGDLFSGTTVHDFDTARWLLGEIDEVYAMLGADDEEEAPAGDRREGALVLLRFASGAVGMIQNVGYAGSGYQSVVEVVGSRGTIQAGAHPRSHDTELLASGGAVIDYPVGFADCFRDAYVREVEHFRDCIRFGRHPSVCGEDGVLAAALCESAARSVEERRPVRVDRPRRH